MDHEALGVADIGEVREQLNAVDKSASRFPAAADAERKNGAASTGQVLFRERVIGAGSETGILDPGHARVLAQPLGYGQCVLAVLLHAEAERFDPLQKEKGVKGTEAGPEVA